VIPGVHVGHVTDLRSLTGCTAILPERPAVGALEIAGWAAGVHGIEFLDPRHVAPTIDGIVLAGGSAFGLEAVWGAMQYLEERGRGFPATRTVIPHVAGAIIFDLNVGDHRIRPDRAMGYAACAAAQAGPVEEGNVGAGTGATVGKLFGIERAMRGGLGVAQVERDGIVTAALMVVNAVGDVRDPATGQLIAGARDAADGRRLVDSAAALEAGATPPSFRPVNTTIGVIATTAALGKSEAARVARLGLQGFERALSPPHLPADGDALFCLSVGNSRTDLASLGKAAADAVATAIARAVLCATSLPGLPAARDLTGRNW
jgi:L-aminopeptidase/D-esterase-like protein